MSIAKEFILAAERHKVVCEKLLAMPELDNLRPNNGNYPFVILKLPQKHILSDIYYLGGYIIECSCSAAIYSYYPTLQHKKELKLEIKDKDNKLRQVKFDAKEPTVFSVCGEGNHSLHHFTKFPAFFETLSIPLLNGDDTKFASKNCYNLYDCFYAEIRYALKAVEDKRNIYPNIQLHYENVTSFLEIGCEIYSSVRKTFKI
jgi:hypothetical protein